MNATTRSKARYARAAAILPKITLGPDEAAALETCRAAGNSTDAAIVRRLLLDEAVRIRESNPALGASSSNPPA